MGLGVDEEFIQPPKYSGVVGEGVCVGSEPQMEEGRGRGAGGLGEIRAGGREKHESERKRSKGRREGEEEFQE